MSTAREDRLDEEVRLHIEMATAANIRAGMTPEEAHRAARMAFGAAEHYKDEARDQFRSRWLMITLQDCRYALRSARRHWLFTAIVIATFALGIGANTAMFTLVDTVLISPLPYAEPDRLVLVGSTNGGTSAPDFLDFRARNSVFTSLALWATSQATLSGGPVPEAITSLDVSASFLATVGVRPVIGRDFTVADEASPRSAVMLSHAFWLRRYNGDRSIVGRSVVIDGRGVTVVGIAPPELDWNLTGDIYRPFDFHAPHATVRAYRTQPVLARLRPGVSLRTAQASMNVIESALGAVYPEDAHHTITVRSYQDTMVAGVGPRLLYLLTAVVLVLCIACGNIVSLMLAQATARQQELSTRVALGASRVRLVQQLVTESTLLAVVGGAIGLLLAAGLLHAVRLDAATPLPRTDEVHLNVVSFAVTAALSLLAGTIVGMASAWRATAAVGHRSLTGGGHDSHAHGGARIRDMIVALQIVASLVLVASASVLLQAFWRLAHVDPGFDDRGVVTGTISLPVDRYSPSNAFDWWTSTLPQLTAIPRVTDVSAASQVPLSLGGTSPYTLPGAVTTGFGRPNAMIDVVTAHYFETMRIPIISGNGFGKETAADQPVEVVISRSVATRLREFGPVIGQQITFPELGSGGFTGRVVGVAGDVRADLGHAAPDIVYFRWDQQMSGYGRHMHLLIRTDGDPLALTPQIRRIVAQQDPLLALGQPQTMADIIGNSVARQRLDTVILGGFGAVALLLAALGLYGLLAYAVAARAHEFSIRLALGARRSQLFTLVVGNGMRLVTVGLAVGLLLVPVVMRMLRSAFGEMPSNGAAIGASVALLGLVGLCACVIPGIKAMRVGAMPGGAE